MNIHLETSTRELFLSKLLKSHSEVEAYLSLLLKTSINVRTRDEFFGDVQSLWKSFARKPVDTTFLAQIIEVLRLTGLFNRKYYQRSVLGTFFLAYNLKILSFLQIFQNNLSFMLGRHFTQKISLKNFQMLLISCSKWYIHILKQDYSGWKLQVFQDVLCLAFDRFTNNDYLKTSIRPVLKEYLSDQYLKLHSMHELRSRGRLKPVDQPKKDLFVFPKFQQRERGLVLVKVLTDIYDWMIMFTSPKEDSFAKSYEPPFFDILFHAKKAKVIFKDKREEKDRIKSVPVSQYTRTVTWIIGKKITRRERIFLTKTKNLQDIDALGLNALELTTYIRKQLKIAYTKIHPNKKRRVLVFTPTSNLINEHIKQQITKLDFTCGCCIYLAKHTKIDCLFFKKLEYLALLGHITIPANLQSLYTERINPIFSTKVVCPFLNLKKIFTIQLKESKRGEIRCAICLASLKIHPSSKTPAICRCNAQYSIISPKMTKNRVFKCQLAEQHSILTKQVQSDLNIIALTEHDYKQINQPELSSEQVFRPQSAKLNLLFTRGSGYIRISEDDSIYHDRKRKLLLNNQIPYDLTSLKLIDTMKWNPVLQTIAEQYPLMEFNHRFENIILSREDKVTIITDKIPSLHIKRPRKKEMEIYPLNNLKTVYNIGKPRLTKILDDWGVLTIYSSIKGISKKPREEIKEAMKLPGVQQTLQQLHIQGLMISHMNAIYYLNELACKYEKDWMADRYKSWMNKLLQYCPTRLRKYYQGADTKSFRQISAFEAWFSRPFAEGVRKFIISVQNEKNPLIQRSYGRVVARRVKKVKKQGVDYMGGYTSYDATLNCVNRRLRHQLRIWNAKAGLGFHTIPLFVHTASDKPGRAGHLDLEEVGRIITRLTLCEAIAKSQINPFHFQRRYDDDNLPYYVPKELLVRWLRGVIVKQQIFPKEIFYNNQWIAFENAHKNHVQHLCSCLEKSLGFNDFNERVMFLRENYQPLIFQPNFLEIGSNPI